MRGQVVGGEQAAGARPRTRPAPPRSRRGRTPPRRCRAISRSVRAASGLRNSSPARGARPPGAKTRSHSANSGPSQRTGRAVRPRSQWYAVVGETGKPLLGVVRSRPRTASANGSVPNRACRSRQPAGAPGTVTGSQPAGRHRRGRLGLRAAERRTGRHRRPRCGRVEGQRGRRPAGGVEPVQPRAVPDDGEQVAADVVGAGWTTVERDRGGDRGVDRVAAPAQDRQAGGRRERLAGGDDAARARSSGLRRRCGTGTPLSNPLPSAARERRRPYAGRLHIPPGSATGPWPRQPVTSASSAVDVPLGQRSAPRSARRTGAAPGCGSPPAAPRARRPAGRPSSVAGVRGRTLGQLVERRVVRGRQRRDPGQVGDQAGAEGRRRAPAAPCAPGPGRTPGRRCAGRPRASGPAAAHAARRRPGAASSSGRRNVTPSITRTAGMPASPRGPPPRASASSTVSAWSSRVCPSRTVAAPQLARRRAQRLVAGLPGGRLRATRPAGDLDRDRQRPGRSPAAAAHATTAAARSAEPGCS